MTTVPHAFAGRSGSVPATELDDNFNALAAAISGGATLVELVTVTGTAYTLTPADRGKAIRFTSASPVTLTVPTGLGTMAQFLCAQDGAGQVSVVGSGMTNTNLTGSNQSTGQGAKFDITTWSATTFKVGGEVS